MTFILSYVVAAILVPYLGLPELVRRSGYLGVFTLGFLYVYTLTTGIATLTLIAIAEEFDLILEGVIAGLGALLGDLLLSYLMREGLNEELFGLAKELLKVIGRKLPPSVKGEKIIISLACGVIASPLPTELGAAMLSLVRELPIGRMVLIMGSLHAAGIFSLLILGTALR